MAGKIVSLEWVKSLITLKLYFMLRLVFLITTLALYLPADAQKLEKLEPYNYPTALKGGYKIVFKANDSLQYLYLNKGNKTITMLSETGRGMLYKSLGVAHADFKNYFILAQGFGPQNPVWIELIHKATGKNCIKKGSFLIDTQEEKEILLYCHRGVPTKKDKMILFNVKTGQKHFLLFPTDIFGEPSALSRIQIKTITAERLVISFDTEKGAKTKAYFLSNPK